METKFSQHTKNWRLILNIPKTIFCDIDGVLFQHTGSLDQVFSEPIVISGTREKIQEWHLKGYIIILTTGRMPSLKSITEAQLIRAKIPYHDLIMGVSRGQRVLINDYKSNSNEPTAIGITLKRNKGIQNLDI